jgi:hypothetical protein
VGKAEIAQNNSSIEEVMEGLGNEQLDLSLFDKEENEKAYYWSLKEDMVATGMIPFLKAFYKDYYKDPQLYQKVIELLEAGRDWQELAKGKSEVAFQEDRYAPNIYVPTKQWRKEVPIKCMAVHLALEGKIMAESYGKAFRFLTQCMQEKYSEYAIAGALRLYITE